MNASLPDILQQALLACRAGDWSQAEHLYRQATEIAPRHGEALNNLGNVLQMLNRHAEATTYHRKALEIDPRLHAAWNSLGLAERACGRPDEAMDCFRRALEIRPDFANAHNNLGNILYECGRYAEACEHYRQAVTISRDFKDAWNNLGLARRASGETAAAIEAFRHALRLEPSFAEAHSNLGLALLDQGQPAEACKAFARALSLRPGQAETHLYLGNAHYLLAHYEEAQHHYMQALKLGMDSEELWNNLGLVHRRSGRPELALECFEKARRLAPDSPQVQNNLGICQLRLGHPNRAIGHFRRALQLKPDFAEAWNNLGNACRDRHHNEEAISHYRQALRLQPDFMDARSNMLFLMSYNVLATPREMLAAHRKWDQIHGGPEKARTFVHAPDPDPGRRLRIGYVSPDFRRHAVAYFLEPILANHDPRRVEVYCYAEVGNPDAMTRHLQGLAHHWCITTGMGDEELAHRIHADHIDILVDLAGHTSGNRLGAFAFKPAPVQATYLGYFTTTGLAAMDYWITDEILHPADTPELATETLYRLPRCCLAYRPPDNAPPVTDRDPARPVVFASFNQIAKTSPQALALWARVLRAVPDSRLLIKTSQLADEAVCRQLLRQFAGHDIPAQRLILRAHTASHREHLATYGEVDIALDTLPRTGGSTTAEALWMGVPVISLAGGRFIQRLSATMLDAAGLGDLITPDEEAYVARAVALASDRARLGRLRATLRERLHASPLCDGRGLARTLEEAYRDMWHRWLAGRPATEDRP